MPLCRRCRAAAASTPDDPSGIETGLDPGESCDVCPRQAIDVSPAPGSKGMTSVKMPGGLGPAIGSAFLLLIGLAFFVLARLEVPA